MSLRAPGTVAQPANFFVNEVRGPLVSLIY